TAELDGVPVAGSPLQLRVASVVSAARSTFAAAGIAVAGRPLALQVTVCDDEGRHLADASEASCVVHVDGEQQLAVRAEGPCYHVSITPPRPGRVRLFAELNGAAVAPSP